MQCPMKSLEVGPKVKPEEAGSDANRRLNLKGEHRTQLRGKLEVGRWRRRRIDSRCKSAVDYRHSRRTRQPMESGAGRKRSRTIYIRRKLEVDRAMELRFNVQLYCEFFKNETPETFGFLAFSFFA
jgi:hypothetical protein